MRLADLARELGARLEGDGEREVDGLAPIDEAGPRDVTFVGAARYRPLLARSRAAAVILGPREDACGRIALRVGDPYAAFVRAASLFVRGDSTPRSIHPTAVIDASATIGPDASIGPYVVIGAGVRIGAGATLHAHVTVYQGVEIGDGFLAHAGAVVREHVRIGNGVVLQAGAVVGGEGFGFLAQADAVPLPIPQLGSVELGDHVEVGANSTIDRAAIGATRLERGVKLDNLVMVGHGSRIGESSMLAGQVGLAGSTVLGKRVLVGGQAGFAGHLEVGDDARVAARSGVIADVAAGATVAGMPATAVTTWRRYALLLARLPELFRRMRRLERALGPSDPP